MSILPYVALWTVLAAAGAAGVPLKARSNLTFPLTATAVLAAFGLWFWARPDSDPIVASLLGYSFSVTSATWHLTGLVLLLVLTAAVWGWRTTALGRGPHAAAAWSSLLGAALLPFLWAGDPLTAVFSLAIFLAVWLVAFWREEAGGASEGNRLNPMAPFLLAPVLLLWFAAAVAVGGPLPPAAAEFAGAAVLLAGAMLLGSWPAIAWRTTVLRPGTAGALALSALPVVAGAAVLLPLAQGNGAGPLTSALALVLGLLSLLLSLRFVWRSAPADVAVPGGLAGATAGLVLLAAVFGTEDGLLGAARVASLVPIVVMLATHVGHGSSTSRLMRIAGVAAVAFGWLAFLGAPLTAGFANLATLYQTWQFGPRLLLLGVLVLLMTAWSAALWVLIRQILRENDPEQAAGAGHGVWPGLAALIVPLIGLIRVAMPPLAEMTILTWAALFLPLILGPLLASLLADRIDLADIASTPLLPEDRTTAVINGGRQGVALVGDAFAEALAILEGPSGLLWILVIIGLLFLVV